eukprot:m.145083 g.145083  ORF g.145083 m.145083 type:complete len:78 (+) comp24266_c0_seq8:3-236(+)
MCLIVCVFHTHTTHLQKDPGETSPVEVPADIVTKMLTLWNSKLMDVANTFRSKADYATGGQAARPCCNSALPACQCH